MNEASGGDASAFGSAARQPVMSCGANAFLPLGRAAEIARRIFERYAETRSFCRVYDELNDAGILASERGSW